jgi:hypothetical protein
MRRFTLHRNEDQGGVSGTGIVAEGVQFTSGKCVLSWLTEFSSIAIYDNMATLEAIHGHGGRTEVHWEEEHHPTIPAGACAEEKCPTCQHVPFTSACPFRCHPTGTVPADE